MPPVLRLNSSIELIPPIPPREAERLAALSQYEVMDSLPEQLFDDITNLAANICGTPIALISLVDEKRQWFKSRVGLDATETHRDAAFCAHAILEPNDVMVIGDATLDHRFQNNPLVTGGPDIRFYAGAPIVTPQGLAVGTVCVIDREPRALTAAQQSSLKSLSRLVLSLLEDRKRQIEAGRRVADQYENRLQHMQEVSRQSPDLTAYIDHEYRWQFVNDAYLHYWQVTRESIEGKLLVDVIGEKMFFDIVKPQIDVALRGEVATFERVFDFPLCGLTPVEIRYSPVYRPDGAIVGCVGRVQNIRERKEHEAQLSASRSALEAQSVEQQRFIHIVSHDLREPVNSIVNFTTLLQTELHDQPPVVARHLNFVHRSGVRLTQLLEGLSRSMNLQKHLVCRERVDLNDLMQTVADNLHAALERTGGKVQWAALPTISADPALLQLALQNLVANSLKFSRPGVAPLVEVSATSAGNTVDISVADNGIGIPKDQFENIFEVFRRLHSRKSYEGNGLGLSNCRSIAELHNGRITVTSELGHGSRFVLSLPQSTPAESEGPL
jgi:PAS domain S-box-containing protein